MHRISDSTFISFCLFSPFLSLSCNQSIAFFYLKSQVALDYSISPLALLHSLSQLISQLRLPTQLENTMSDVKSSQEKVARSNHDLGGDTDKDLEDTRDRLSSEAAVATTKIEDDGPPDGGTAAWMVLLGAWCCSFSSPGWINSEFRLFGYSSIVKILTRF